LFCFVYNVVEITWALSVNLSLALNGSAWCRRHFHNVYKWGCVRSLGWQLVSLQLFHWQLQTAYDALWGKCDASFLVCISWSPILLCVYTVWYIIVPVILTRESDMWDLIWVLDTSNCLTIGKRNLRTHFNYTS
jgi:hypothetical protein